jgi:hypothetical protein
VTNTRNPEPVESLIDSFSRRLRPHDQSLFQLAIDKATASKTSHHPYPDKESRRRATTLFRYFSRFVRKQMFQDHALHETLSGIAGRELPLVRSRKA